MFSEIFSHKSKNFVPRVTKRGFGISINPKFTTFLFVHRNRTFPHALGRVKKSILCPISDVYQPMNIFF